MLETGFFAKAPPDALIRVVACYATVPAIRLAAFGNKSLALWPIRSICSDVSPAKFKRALMFANAVASTVHGTPQSEP